ncbi:MAG: hypothetical protein H6502_00770 [Candidatus Woesearchaeota archaeon]|nr:MAG: hypothetical protein H6502_00770 [Candidatus Woesearchaeota archaeon]
MLRQLAKGTSKQQIVDKLQKAGWSNEEVMLCLERATMKQDLTHESKHHHFFRMAEFVVGAVIIIAFVVIFGSIFFTHTNVDLPEPSAVGRIQDALTQSAHQEQVTAISCENASSLDEKYACFADAFAKGYSCNSVLKQERTFCFQALELHLTTSA